MAIQIRSEGDVAILSSFGRLMDDPRHFDAGRDVEAMLDQGFRKFALELRGVGTMGASGFGLLMTITRAIRRRGGEVVLTNAGRGMEKLIEEMQMDDYWEVCASLAQAKAYLDRTPSRAGHDAGPPGGPPPCPN